ncbi:hypothetical protein [Cohnella rhizosphaerae]|uniref:Uncharacterized protein n=1 Tax=Cohnella rhizosphaerae TaxID=1457232 RepID=A0A9X4QWX2_9BACL|nr:hypothetical protein [Cohnella rhizosphaerae]MDG0814255.1 hypothetical protein [Cohnella rhizosphaerae]
MSRSETDKKLRRVTLEMSLKPFTSMALPAIEAVCEEAIRQWLPLIGMAEGCSMLLWVADGSEILDWDGNGERNIEWGALYRLCERGSVRTYRAERSPDRQAVQARCLRDYIR